MDPAIPIVGLVGLVVGSFMNRLIVREPGYVITDPNDLPEDADESMLDELEDPPTDLPPVPVLAVVRPGTWWRRWFPVTEIVTAVAFGLTVDRFGLGVTSITLGFLHVALLTLAAIDFRVYRIPDRINFPAMGIGLAVLVVASLLLGTPWAIVGALVGGVLYSGMLFFAHLISPRGMGWGDVKLAWLMGFFLGWRGFDTGSVVEVVLGPFRSVLLGAALGSVLGVVVGLAYALARRSAKVVFPYGPSLAVGCMLAVVYGQPVS